MYKGVTVGFDQLKDLFHAFCCLWVCALFRSPLDGWWAFDYSFEDLFPLFSMRKTKWKLLMQAKVGLDKEFQVALRKLRGKDADITREAAEIQVLILNYRASLKACNFICLRNQDYVSLQVYIHTLRSLPKASIRDLFKTKYIRSVIVSKFIILLIKLTLG